MWSVPTVKMPRMLVTSAYALQQLLKKTDLIGLSSVQVGYCTACSSCNNDVIGTDEVMCCWDMHGTGKTDTWMVR